MKKFKICIKKETKNSIKEIDRTLYRSILAGIKPEPLLALINKIQNKKEINAAN